MVDGGAAGAPGASERVRLVTFQAGDATQLRHIRLGALLAGDDSSQVVDLNRALALKLEAEDVGAPEAEADSLIPSDLLRFLQRGARAQEVAARTLAWVQETLLGYEGPDLVRERVVHARDAVRLGAPIARPGKIIVFRDLGAAEPELSLKPATAICGPEQDIVIPRGCRHVEGRGDLVVVIGCRGRDLPRDRIHQHIAGFCIGIDVRARGFSGAGGWCDSFAPIGPALVSRDEIPDAHDLALRSLVSAEPYQELRTKEARLPVEEVVSRASQLMTLEPGDLIFSGVGSLSPHRGNASGREGGRALRDGDVVEVAIEKLGRLRSHVRRQL